MELAQPRFDYPVGNLPYRDRKDQTPVKTVYAYAGRYVKGNCLDASTTTKPYFLVCNIASI